MPVSELVFDVDGVPMMDEQELEITCRVLQIFARFPEASLPARFAKDSNEYAVRSNIRVNAMRWLKPTGVCVCVCAAFHFFQHRPSLNS